MFRLIVWFLTPAASSIGPALRNYLNNEKYLGNLTAMWKKGLALNKRYIDAHHLSMYSEGKGCFEISMSTGAPLESLILRIKELHDGPVRMTSSRK